MSTPKSSVTNQGQSPVPPAPRPSAAAAPTACPCHPAAPSQLPLGVQQVRAGESSGFTWADLPPQALDCGDGHGLLRLAVVVASSLGSQPSVGLPHFTPLYALQGQHQGSEVTPEPPLHIRQNLQDIHSDLLPAGRFSSVQALSHVRLFATPWTAVGQASLSITNS